MSTGRSSLDAGRIRPTWVEIDLGAFDRNVTAVAARLPAESKLIAVLKADGYGHGAVELGRRCQQLPVTMIATALLEEAVELRRAKITLPLLVFGALSAEQVRMAVDDDIIVGIPGPETLVNAAAVARDRDVRIHLKLDSGMGRMGLIESELADAVDLIRATPRLRLEAIYSHYATADDGGDPLTSEQRARFRTLVATLAEAGLRVPLHHFANSAATMRGLVEPGDYVRAGLSLYGAEPLNDGESRLEPVMRWRTEIVRLKELSAGHAVGYGATYRTTRTTRVATLPVGYADGYDRGLSNRGFVIVRGQRAPIIGRVSMDLTTIDVTDIAGVAVGDEVVLLGPAERDARRVAPPEAGAGATRDRMPDGDATRAAGRAGDGITAEELAAKLGTISYEVFCSVSARVPRVYRDGADIVSIRSRFA
jgi:alanine racemase